MRTPYEQVLKEAIILPNWMDEANSFKRHFEKNIEIYREVWAHTNVPTPIIAVLNMLETGGRFDRHLANGDPLSARTKQVPAGLPKEGNPPFTFLEGAIAAIKHDKIDQHPWSVDFVADLKKLESYNGLGYLKKDVNSPYILSGSQFYTKGKYVADGVYDPNAVSKQLGVWALLHVVRYFKS